jgi:hypothetical protein
VIADSLVECEFVEFLVAKLGLEMDERPTRGEWCRLGNTIGAITLRLNLLSDAEVNEILRVQDVEGGLFGELAVRAGYLTREQVAHVLEIQQLHDQLHMGEQLVAVGRLDLRVLLDCLAEFLASRE